MKEDSAIFIGLETSKLKISVAVADGLRNGEVRFFGDISSDPASVASMVNKLSKRGAKLHCCYEAGPTGYGLYRQIVELGHDCVVVAPSLVPKRAGDRVKTNRRVAGSLARLHRTGELTAVWVPDEAHEAIRDLVRAREAANDALKQARQQLQSFLLRHSRIYTGRTPWTRAHTYKMASTPGLRSPRPPNPVGRILPGHRGCRRASGQADPAGGGDRGILVDGPGCGCLPSDARRRVHDRGHLCGRNRRCQTLRQPSSVDGVSGSCAVGKLDGRTGQAWGDHQGGQHARAKGPHRRRLDISLPGPCKPDNPSTAGGIAWKRQVRLCARYRKLMVTGKPKVVAVTAIAREMAAFLWRLDRR